MVVIWDILKKTMVFGWEEIIYLVPANIVTLTALLAGPSLMLMGINRGAVWLMLAGSVAIFAIPPALFGLFWLTYQTSLGNAVKFSTFVDGAKQNPKPMYIWGGINFIVSVTLISNIVFYQGFTANWAVFVGQLFYGLLIFWIILQLLTLAMYPHLEVQSFRTAFTNSLKLMAINPFAVVGMAIITIGVMALGGYTPVVLGLLAVSFTALIASVTVEELTTIARKKG